MENALQIVTKENRTRMKRLLDELEYALSKTSSNDMIIWGKDSVKIQELKA